MTVFTMLQRRSPVAVPGASVHQLFAGLLLTLCVAGCAARDEPVVVVPAIDPFELKMAQILRLEDERLVREPVEPSPATALPGTAPSEARPTPSLARPTPSLARLTPSLARLPADLTLLLRDPQARVRRRAALAIGRVGSSEGAPGLLALLSGDPEMEVRQMAAFALGLMRDPSAIELLRAALVDPSPLVQGRAAEALSQLGDSEGAEAIGQMVRQHVFAGALTDLGPDDLTYPVSPPVEAVRLGVYALARLQAFDALSAAVFNDEGRLLSYWWPLAYALQRTGDERAIPALRQLAQTQTTYARSFAVRGLGELGDAESGPLIVPLIPEATSNPAVGVEAIRASARLQLTDAGPPLVRLAFDGTVTAGLRAEALRALPRVGALQGPPRPRGSDEVDESPDAATLAREGLFDLVTDPSPMVRTAALEALASLDANTFTAVLAGMDPDPQWEVRAALATTLGALPANRVETRLRLMLEDADARVLPAVLESLARVDASEVETILVEHLRHDDPMVRAAAARRLGERHPAGAFDALVAALRFAERDASYVARAAALEAVAGYGLERARSYLREALDDPDWAVRVRAADLLRELGAPIDPDEIRPAPVRRAQAVYDTPELIAPSVSPHVFFETDKGTIGIEMAVLDAPLTAATFMDLARQGFFNGLRFHRVVSNFVVQTGDPRGDGEGGPGFTIRDEINERPFLRGVVGIALDWRETGGSQFFVTNSPQPQLDGRYTVFGHVVSGMEVVDRIEQGDTIRTVRVWDGGVQGAAAVQP